MSAYFEYDDAGGAFSRTTGAGLDGSVGMRAVFRAGEESAGALHLAIGRTPNSYFRPADAGTSDYRDLYWRMFIRMDEGWTGGGGYKLSRAFSFASTESWAQAMIAHVWSEGAGQQYLAVDPASGTSEGGTLMTTSYNDFDNLRWLGLQTSSTPVFADDRVGQWYCVEARARLNDAGSSNGVFQLWIDGTLEAERTGLNWVGSFDAYRINAVYVENYWNGGAPKEQGRVIDNFVVSTARIGCPE